MSTVKIHRFAKEPVFRLSGETWSLDASQENAVSEIWRAAAADPSRRLGDNAILCVIEFGETVDVAPIPYRCFLAQTVQPELFRTPLTALAVSGILLCEHRLVLGRRAERVMQDPGALELVPSGSVDADIVSGGRINVSAQLDREAAEELGIGGNALFGHRLLGAVEDEEKHVIDMVIEAALECSFGQLLDAHSRLEQPEYSQLLAVTHQELQRMIDDGSERISAVSIAIFANFYAAPE